VTFKDQLQDDLENVFFNSGEFADDATYTTFEGVSTAIHTIFSSAGDFISVEPGQAMAASFQVMKSEIASPKIHDSIVRNGETWRITDIPTGEGDVWQISARREERPKL